MARREGLKAVQMFEAVERGKIKALWVMGTNPAVSLPRANSIGSALKKLELFVISENVLSNDTVNAAAHVLLPAAAWGEKDGTVTNSERCISRQRSFLPLPAEAKPDWWIVSQIACQLGFSDAFSYASAADIFREHAALSCFENGGTRAFDIGGLATVSDVGYAALAPVQWPLRADGSRTARFFSQGGFFTPDRKARFVTPEQPALNADLSAEFPLRLNTGRVRDQWHTMTRSGKSVRLAGHRPEPFVEIHPLDAANYRLKQDGFAEVTTPHGRCILKVVIDAGQRPGCIFVPIHWSKEKAASARVNDLVAAATDPHSGQPEAKATPASIAPVQFAYAAFALTRHSILFPPHTWWARIPYPDATGYLLASNDRPMRWHELTPRLFGKDAVLTQYLDQERGIYRVAAFHAGRFEGGLFLAPADAHSPWSAMSLFERGALSGTMSHLPTQSAALPDGGEMLVCACFGVGLKAIRKALVSPRIADVEGIGRALRAGTRCGSCLPELRSIVANRERQVPLVHGSTVPP